jgi:hypothetical protein
MLMRKWKASSATTTTTTSSTTTTTTIDCNQTYSIDVYAKSNKECELCTSCGGGECPECDSIVLEYSLNAGSTWNSASIYFDTADNVCTYFGTFTVGICETDLRFRIISANRCSGPIYFNYSVEPGGDQCPGVGTCGDCSDSETTNVMPTANSQISFSICTECWNSCCSVCCV